MKRSIAFLAVLCLWIGFLSSCASAPRALLPMAADEAVRSLQIALGGQIPKATDFLTDEARAYCDAENIEVSFVGTPAFQMAGRGSVELRLARGGRSQTLTANVMVRSDTTPPTLIGVKELSLLVGEALILREGVSATDDCFGDVEWTVDASAVDISRAGVYSATYRAVDAVGNAAEQRVYVHVHETAVTEEMLQEKLLPLLDTLCTQGDSTEQICQSIHSYVKNNIAYFPISDKTDPTRAAYDALFGTRRGDCYSYYASARALLLAADMEILTLERTHEAGEETHIWLMVNLAKAGETPRWYHFDPTLIQDGGPANGGCLFTDAELEHYNTTINPGFYDHDCTVHPPTE